MVPRQYGLMESEPVPEADALEQKRALHEDGDEHIDAAGDRPVADALDQRRAVAQGPTVSSPAERGEVSEADWYDQQVSEPIDDEVR